MLKYDEYLDNCLVHQKNFIIKTINDGDLIKATVLLDFCQKLWTLCDYNYKWAELVDRINKELQS